ncbi:hypothetical protein Dole_0147 [Desulfosudis oleivorans Hxd3]|uniref:Uncharacterized protein n=1 Tax=Desulfosudis oleivorans (strain DSM 6200 / JCM 39069 / Hxd3) TaxID=96561 RepID=A8ZSP4_DESOH|nr:hypothetical protein Dole_0147 [Desulfosudis oleivorans Hxd3]
MFRGACIRRWQDVRRTAYAEYDHRPNDKIPQLCFLALCVFVVCLFCCDLRICCLEAAKRIVSGSRLINEWCDNYYDFCNGAARAQRDVKIAGSLLFWPDRVVGLNRANHQMTLHDSQHETRDKLLVFINENTADGQFPYRPHTVNDSRGASRLCYQAAFKIQCKNLI